MPQKARQYSKHNLMNLLWEAAVQGYKDKALRVVNDPQNLWLWLGINHLTEYISKHIKTISSILSLPNHLLQHSNDARLAHDWCDWPMWLTGTFGTGRYLV